MLLHEMFYLVAASIAEVARDVASFMSKPYPAFESNLSDKTGAPNDESLSEICDPRSVLLKRVC